MPGGMDPERERAMRDRVASGDIVTRMDADAKAAVQLDPVRRDGRYGTQGREFTVGINCYKADIEATPDMIPQYNVEFWSERKEDPNAPAGRGGRGGRGRGRGRGRGGRGGARPIGPGRSPPDEKAPPLRIAMKLIHDIENGKATEETNKILPPGSRIAYDGKKNVYVSQKPDWTEACFSVESEEKKYKIRFGVAAKVQVDELKAFMKNEAESFPDAAVACLDVAMRTRPLREYILTGRCFSLPNNMSSSNPADKALGLGCEAWRGYYQAFRPIASGLGLFFDVSYAAFYVEQSLLDFASEILQPQGEGGADVSPDDPFPNGLTPGQTRTLKNELLGIRCEQIHLPPAQRKEKVIDGLTSEPASAIMIENEETGRRESVAEHFGELFGRLRCPHMPCVQVTGKKGKDAFIPLEHARVCAGQRRTKSMPAAMTARLLDVASRAPDVRRADITTMLDTASHNTDECMKAFGIKVDTTPMKVKARLLNPPMLRYKDVVLELKPDAPELNWSIAPTGAGADGEQLSRKLFRTGKGLHAWGVLVLAPDVKDTAVQNFVWCMQQICHNAGLEVSKPRYKYGYTKSMLSDMKTLVQQISDDIDPCQLIMVVKQDIASADYNRIKMVGDTMIGVPTQCVVQANVENPREVYCQNVMLKINAKLGGVNVRVQPPSAVGKHIGDGTWMILGVDLSHAAAAEAKDNASVTACVGTMDRACTTYAGKYRLQDSKTETIMEIGDMVKQLLITFYKKNSVLPEKLLVYRDGVSDGQFQTVLTEEVNDIKEVCRQTGNAIKVEGGYEPGVTFVVLQKGHHTRFFPLDDSERDISGNCRAGTVIDSEVTNARNYDFYMFSHNGIQGTSRPVRYTVLYDDNAISADDLQAVTYNMCFTYARCTRTISVVPVATYANLLATRGRAYLSSKQQIMAMKASFTAGGNRGGDTFDEMATGDPVVKQQLTDRLFYI